ncbi:MAG TPA: hypothetical protein VKM93_21165 [Terriglobia bacterium]|nr:hypothetical protein [Terriglobia bacterium]
MNKAEEGFQDWVARVVEILKVQRNEIARLSLELQAVRDALSESDSHFPGSFERHKIQLEITGHYVDRAGPQLYDELIRRLKES